MMTRPVTTARNVDWRERRPPRPMLLLEARAPLELGALLWSAPWLMTAAPRGDGHPVLVLPALNRDDGATMFLRAFLAGCGHAVHGWGLGRNLGRWGVVDAHLVPMLERLHRQSGRRVSVIGWSMGGLYARRLARRRPDLVRSIVMMGSPFGCRLSATNAWWEFELLSGRDADHAPAAGTMRAPPVPRTSIYSRSDAIVPWRCCVEADAPHAENVEVESSHFGLVHHPAALYAVTDRLAQPEDGWRRFDQRALHRLMYPRTAAPAAVSL